MAYRNTADIADIADIADTALGTTSFTPPFGEGSKILNSLRASDLAWLPPTAHGNCSEAARTFAISLPPQCRDLC